MTIRTSTLKPRTETSVEIPDRETPDFETPAVPRLPAPGPRHAKPMQAKAPAVEKPRAEKPVVRPPAEVAAVQAGIEIAAEGGDTYRQLGLVTAMALEQKVPVGDVLAAMQTIVDAWGHLAAPAEVDLP